MSSLRPLVPEPVPEQDLPLGVPITPSRRFSSRAIAVLSCVQKYSTVPLGVFAAVHLSGVVAAPPTAGVGIAEQLMSMGRELYQNGVSETVLLASVTAHVVSGIAIQAIRKWQNYIKYGKKKKSKRQQYGEKEERPDTSTGLGGITYLLGLGSRPSLSFRMFGLTPLRFSGYVLIPVVAYHVGQERLAPLFVEGDSSMVDLSYVSYSLAQSPILASIGLTFLVTVATYHFSLGLLHYIGVFTHRARKNAYIAILSNTVLAALSLFAISKIDQPSAFVARKYSQYLSYLRY
ncbi:hypothetical protein OGAPHI_003744 [Ogataea philodendri]|uniref:Mitochondrial adapter protein MCP1 transmembrane domain-containing protein n=1 Tax=Ogataea philodendri TaxID=1378263 RepID=A0A9P8P5C3_9ASCO|nr:uncharacterized protein OGAPHI_003744 [Ogataea philodendri]KAH3665557.1 hypothetical protein OGAPHI_003744 [Ogataea philodendri]